MNPSRWGQGIDSDQVTGPELDIRLVGHRKILAWQRAKLPRCRREGAVEVRPFPAEKRQVVSEAQGLSGEAMKGNPPTTVIPRVDESKSSPQEAEGSIEPNRTINRNACQFDKIKMTRVPWAPLNGGAFLIIFGTVMLLSVVGVAGLNPFSGIPLVFLAFGIWLVVTAYTFSDPEDRYAPPRSMILAWGAMVTVLGAIWFVGTIAISLVPVVLFVVLVVAGIGAVGYALTRAEAKKVQPAVA